MVPNVLKMTLRDETVVDEGMLPNHRDLVGPSSVPSSPRFALDSCALRK